jgi:aminoglycoside phosphotransferase (APT) family kinase protein
VSAPADERLRDELAAFIGREVAAPVAVTRFAPLPGGTLRRAFALDVEIASGPHAGPRGLLFLQDRGGAPIASRLGRAEELCALAAMHRAGVRVPRPLGVFADGIVMERVEGETLVRRLVRDPAFAAVRPRLLGQMGEELARIHAVPPAAAPGLPGPAPGRTPAEAQLDEIERELRAFGEPHPPLELGLRRLRARPPATTRIVIVHGDYRAGNVVVDPEAGLRAVLDWELAHIGDPGEDLGWMLLRFWGGVDHPGEGALGPAQRFLDGYAAVSGWRPGPEHLRAWELLAAARWATIMLRQTRRHLTGEARSLELAAIGRRRAEVEWELLRLLEDG